MRKLTVIGISILSVFILCSLSYQPIIADTPIEQIVQVKKPKVSNLDEDEIKELYNRMIVAAFSEELTVSWFWEYLAYFIAILLYIIALAIIGYLDIIIQFFYNLFHPSNHL